MQGVERAQHLVGTVLSERYRLTAVLKESSTGATLAAEHVHMRHRVAVKVLYPEAAQRHELMVAFEREALAGAHVEHDNVAGATDYGALPDGLRFLVMEYLEGPTLRQLLARGPLSVGRALGVAVQIARALGSMHQRGIIHRGLSADSVRLVERAGETDVVKVVDFGSALLPTPLIAEEADPRRQTRVATPLRPSGTGLTYGSPELLAGDGVDGRSDLYALGVLLFELVLGAPPPARAYPLPSLRAVRDDVPAGLDELLARLLSPSPADRPADADEVGDAIDELRRRGLAMTSEQAKQHFASAPTAYGGQTPSPVSIREMPPVQSARTAEVSGGWVPLAQRDAIEPRRPVPPRIWLASGGSLGVVLLIVAIVAFRSAPFPEGAAAAVAASTESGEASDTAGGEGETDSGDDDEREVAGGATSGSKKSGSGSPGAPVISLGDLNPLGGDPPLSTPESIRAFEEVRNLRRMRKVQSAVAKLDELLEMNPRAPEDKEVRGEIFELAQSVMVTNGPEAEQLYGWLASRIGHHGPDILYQLLTTKGGSRAAKRAERSLRDPKIQARFSEELRIAYGLRMGSECAAQPELLAAAGVRGDRRAYGALYRVRELCDRRGQCCREHYEALKLAIKSMEARGYR